MAINPIDLQTLFGRMAEVGKEQAAARDASLQAQSAAAQQIKQRQEHDRNAVTQASDLDEGAEGVRDDETTDNGGRRSAGGKRDAEPEPEDPKTEVVHDPNLGRTIDLTG